MLIDVLRTDLWDGLNEATQNFLGLSSAKTNIRVYRGIGHAAYEICRGTAQFFTHKKSIAVITGQTDVTEKILAPFYKDLYEVHIQPHVDLQNLQGWVDTLPKETCFVLYAEDQPVTGEIFSYADQLDQLLNQKRIYSLRISHARHFSESIEIRPYTVRMCSFSADSAVALCGERFRSPAVLCDLIHWHTDSFLEEIRTAREQHTVDADLVQKFEKDVSPYGVAYFEPERARTYDRAVCYFPDVSAQALIETVIRKSGLPMEEGWKKISTTNICYWGGAGGHRMFRQWWLPEPNEEVLRGLLVCSVEILKTNDFAKQVLSSYEDIKKQQSWTV